MSAFLHSYTLPLRPDWACVGRCCPKPGACCCCCPEIGFLKNGENRGGNRYRTLASLSGLGPVEPGVQGTSLAPLFDDAAEHSPAVAAAARALPDKVALSQFARCNCVNRTGPGGHDGFICDHCVSNKPPTFQFMGLSLRSPRGWRCTEWLAWNGTAIAPDWHDVRGVELYDHRGDDGTNFDAYENVNLAAGDAGPGDGGGPNATIAAEIARLHAELVTAFRGPAAG